MMNPAEDPPGIGWHWMGETPTVIRSSTFPHTPGAPDDPAGVILATSTGAIRFVSNDFNYHNYAARYDVMIDGTIKKMCKCTVTAYSNTNGLMLCTTGPMSYNPYNFRQHMMDVHRMRAFRVMNITLFISYNILYLFMTYSEYTWCS